MMYTAPNHQESVNIKKGELHGYFCKRRSQRNKQASRC